MNMWRSVVVRVNHHDQPVDPGNDGMLTIIYRSRLGYCDTRPRALKRSPSHA